MTPLNGPSWPLLGELMAANMACPHCDTVQSFAAHESPGRCSSCGATVFANAAGVRVILAHSDRSVGEMAGTLLVGAGMHPIMVARGAEVVAQAKKHGAVAAVVDVAFDNGAVVSVIEGLRQQIKPPPKILLLVTPYNQAAYRRAPKALHGADDWIEAPQVQAQLVNKIDQLLGSSRANRVAETARIQALAYSIVADMVIVHLPHFEAAMRRGETAHFEPSLTEGRQLLAQMVDLHDCSLADPVGSAFAAFVAHVRQEFT